MVPPIEPVCEPYAPDVAARLAALMPPGEPPIRLFRTFVRNLPMAAGLNAWGGYYLSRKLSLSLRERELVIDRTTPPAAGANTSGACTSRSTPTVSS